MLSESNLPSGAPNFTIDRPDAAAAGVRLNVADYGAVPGDRERCAGPAFARAIADCRNQEAALLVVPPGTYYFTSGEHLRFEGLNNFIFEGQGAELIFSTVRDFITIKDCRNVLFRNFRVDWDWERQSLAEIGVVKAVAPDYSRVDLVFPDAKGPADREIRGFNPADPLTLAPGCEGGIEFSCEGFLQSVREPLPDGSMRLYAVEPARLAFLRPGQHYVVRYFTYDANGIVMADNEHLTLEEVTLYSAPGHAFFAYGDQHHWTLRNCRVMRRPGTTRCITSTADGCHIGNSRGYFVMEGCDFSYSGDDCLNLHDNSVTKVVRTGDRSMLLGDVRPVRDSFSPGDVLEFRRGDLSPMNLHLRVETVDYQIAEGRCALTLDGDLPLDLPYDTIVFNRRFHSGNFIIRRNHFHQNRARGILLLASNGTIEDNRFYRNQGSAIQIETGVAQWWSEGHGVDNLVFRNNLIESCDVNHWNMAVVYMGTYLPSGRTEYPVFTNILFENNTIVNAPQQAIFLSSCRGVLVRGNAIINSNVRQMKSDEENDANGLKDRALYKGAMMISHASHVDIRHNRRMQTVPASDSGIYLSPGTTSDIRLIGNEGI